jgi:hypothetical protein
LLTDPNARITPDCARELAAKLPAFLRRHPSLQISSHYQPSGGSDQASFTVWHPDDALALLRDSAFRRALRVHTLGLMRTPAGHATSSHCPTLADALIGC